MPENLESLFTPSDLVSLRRRLNNWFRKHGRQLPWRETHDPYFIWISEIMLQQTTVKAVVPYFERFVNRFPTIHELAAASEEEVLQYWEGLGYYSRGRNIRKAAILIRDQYDGIFPKSLSELQKLPGVGRYTAGAIRSFAFDLPAPIVEANTLRLYCRLLNFKGDPRSREGEKLLWSFAEELQPKSKAGQVNQALMELGSQICTPVDPQCESCSISMHCHAFASGTQNVVPIKKVRPKVTQVVEATVAVHQQGKYLVRQRQPEERWAGMWDFVRFPIESVTFKDKLTKARQSQLQTEIAKVLAKEFQLRTEAPQVVTEIKHSVTRYRIRLLCCEALIKSKISSVEIENTQWLTLAELENLPMPITGRQFSQKLAKRE